MENAEGEKDESSIKPVSALRSRFENLVTDASIRPASPVGSRSPFLPPVGTPTTGRPSTPLREGTWPVQRNLNLNEDALARPPRRSPSPPKSRPQSISGTSPTRKWAPVVTVDSPRSPDRKHAMSVDLSNSNVSTPRGSFDIARTGTDSPSKPPNARPPSRTPTPALEARINALSGSIITPKATSDGVSTAPPTPDLKPKTQTSSVPPPVNRAGKPTIPLKPTNLTKKSEGLSAPEPSHAELTDQSVSPFSTPPSSGAGSPHQRTNSDATSHGRKDSELSSSYFSKVRGNSDASWVETIRTNSDPSITGPPQRTRHESDTTFLARARAGSNASFVEASTLPEDWHHFQPPPINNSVAARRDPLPNGLSRPARYRPIGSQEQIAAGDLLSDIPEDRPRLPVRPEVQRIPGRGSSPPKSYSRSGRTSPVKEIAMRKSMDAMRRAATMDVEQQSAPRIPASKSNQRSALLQGFDRGPLQPAAAKSSHVAPPIPAPRKGREASVVQERHTISANKDYQTTPRKPFTASRVPAQVSMADTDGQSHDEGEDVVAPTFNWSSNHHTGPSDYPDSSRASRRPPKYGYRPWHIPTEHEARTFAVCGEYVVTTGGHRTKAFNLRTGEQLVDLDHEQAGITKVSSMVFKPSATQEDEGKRVWFGTSQGEILELDLPSQSIVKTRSGVHTRRDVIRMYRYASELWTLDNGGELYVWKPDNRGMPSLDSKFESFRTPKGHTFSIALGRHLWIATGKGIRVFAPSAANDSEFHVLRSPLSQPGTGEVCSGATLSGKPDLVYFGHSDGKVSIYNRHDFSCLGVVNVSMYKLSSLAGVGEYLWTGFNTGMVFVYDVSSAPWRVVKEWQAHEKQILGISAEKSAVWKMNRLQVVTLGTDNMLRIWDGMLEEDWLESRMEDREREFCDLRDVEVRVLTWNAGAAKPYYLQGHKEDDNFFREYLREYLNHPDEQRAPDVFVFGFQELVDLEDKKVTAKSFFKVSKKKDANEQEHMSHQYRAWRDHLTRCIDEYMPPDELYVQLHSASLVGLFTCVFVKSSLRDRIRLVQAVEVKRGMGGIYGNKGALVLRMVIDDSSLCFINCHLAAGQTQTIHRNNDIAAILESDELPAYPLGDESGPGGARHSDVFRCGGDGSMILDHEICVLNGDLNYRIDTMGRDTVIKHIKQRNLERLLERDQLLISRRKNPGFRLRAFQENPITFPPTYKYNLHSDEYDTSEKRRAPAWCDRILYRGAVGKVVMSDYKHWKGVRVSDHRPVSGRLKMKVKTVDAAKRKKVAGVCEREFEEVTKRVARAVQLQYLTDVLGMTMKSASNALDS